jgi:phage-related minor tail protein
VANDETIGSVRVGIRGDYSQLGPDFAAALSLIQEKSAQFQTALIDALKPPDSAPVVAAMNAVGEASTKNAGLIIDMEGTLKDMGAAGQQFSDAAQSIINKQNELDGSVQTAKGALVELKTAFDNGQASAEMVARAEKDLQDAIDKANPSITEGTGAMQKMADASGNLIQAGASITAAVTVPIVGIGVAAFKAQTDLDEAFDHLRAATGLTGDKLADLEGSFRTVFAKVPENAKTVSDAMALIEQRTGLAGDKLEALSTSMLNFTHVTGTSVTEVVPLATRMFGDWSVATDRQSGSLDTIYKISQQTGVTVTDLMGKIVEFGAPLRELGYNFDNGAALVAKWGKEGVNVQTVLSGMKQELGNAAKAGIDTAGSFQELINKLKTTDDTTQGLATAFNNVGKRAAVDFFRAVQEGRFDIDNLVKSVHDSTDTVNRAADDTRSWAEKWQIFQNNLELAIEPLGKTLVDAAEKALEAMGPLLDTIKDIATWFGNLPDSVQLGVMGLGAIAAAIGPLIGLAGGLGFAISGITGAMDTLGLSTETLGGTLTTTFTAVAAPLAIFGAAVAAIHFSGLVDEVDHLWDSLKNVLPSFGSLKDVLDGLQTQLPDLSGLVTVFALGWDEVKRAFNDATSTIKSADVWSAISGPIGAARDTVKGLADMLDYASGRYKSMTDATTGNLATLNKANDDAAHAAADAAGAFDGATKSLEGHAKASGITVDAAKLAAAELKKEQGELENFGKSAELLLNKTGDTYTDYVKKLDDGGQKAETMLKTVQGQLERAATAMEDMHGKPLQAMQEWVDALKDAQTKLKDFADADAYQKIQDKVQAVANKFTNIKPDVLDVFNSVLSSMAEVPGSVSKNGDKLVKWLQDVAAEDDKTDKAGQKIVDHINKIGDAAEAKIANQTIPIVKTLKDRVTDVVTETDTWDSKTNAIVPTFTTISNAAGAELAKVADAFEAIHKAAKDHMQGSTDAAVKAFADIAASSTTSTDTVTAEWKIVSQWLGGIAMTDMPAVIGAFDAYKKRLEDAHAPAKDLYDLQVSELDLLIKVAQARGENTSQYIIQLDRLKEHQQAVVDLQNLAGTTAIAVSKDINKAFDSIGPALITAVTTGKNALDSLANVFKTLGTQILNEFVGTALKALKDELILHTGLIKDMEDAIGKVIGKIGGLVSSLGGGLTSAMGSAAGQVGTLTDSALGATSQLSNLSGALNPLSGIVGTTATSVGSMGSAATTAAGSVASSASSFMGTLTGISSAVSAVTGIIGVFQAAAAEATNKLIEQNTRISAIVESKELPLANAISVEQEATFHDISTFTSVLPDISLHTSVLPDAMKNIIAALGNWDVLFGKLDGLYTAITGIKVTLGGSTGSGSSNSSSKDSSGGSTQPATAPVAPSDATLADNIRMIRESGSRTADNTGSQNAALMAQVNEQIKLVQAQLVSDTEKLNQAQAQGNEGLISAYGKTVQQDIAKLDELKTHLSAIQASTADTAASTAQHLQTGRSILGATQAVADTVQQSAQKAAASAQDILNQSIEDNRTAQQKADDLHDQFLHAQEIAQAGFGQNKAWNDQALSLYNQWLAAQKVADESAQKVVQATEDAARAQQNSADAAKKQSDAAAKAAADALEATRAADQSQQQNARLAEDSKAKQASDLQTKIDALNKEIADNTVRMNEASALQEDDLAQTFKDSIGADTAEVKRLQTKLDVLNGTGDRTAKNTDGLTDTITRSGQRASDQTSAAITSEIAGLKEKQEQLQTLSQQALAAGNQQLSDTYKQQAALIGQQIIALNGTETDNGRAIKDIQKSATTTADDGGRTATNTGRVADDTQHMRAPIDQTATSTAGVKDDTQHMRTAGDTTAQNTGRGADAAGATKDNTTAIRTASDTTAQNTGRGADATVSLKDDTTHLRTAGDQTAQNTSRGADNTKTVADTTQKVVDASDVQVQLLTDAGATLATIEEGTHHLDDILSVLSDMQTPIGAIRIDLDAMFPIIQASLDKGGIIDLGLSGILDAVTPETGLLTKILGAFTDLMAGIQKANDALVDVLKTTNADFLKQLKDEMDAVIKALQFDQLMTLLKKQYDDRIKYDEDKYDLWLKFWNNNITNIRTNLAAIETAVAASTKTLQTILITMNTSLSSISTGVVTANSYLAQIHADSGAIINELSTGVVPPIVGAIVNSTGDITSAISSAASSIGSAISGAISSVGSMVTSAVGAIAAAVSSISVNVTVNVTTPAADSGDGGSSSASSSMAAAPNPPREILGRGVLMMPDIRSIATNPASALAYRSGPTGAGSMNQSITFNVNGAQNPRDTVNAIAAYLKTVARNQAILGS